MPLIGCRCPARLRSTPTGLALVGTGGSLYGRGPGTWRKVVTPARTPDSDCERAQQTQHGNRGGADRGGGQQSGDGHDPCEEARPVNTESLDARVPKGEPCRRDHDSEIREGGSLSNGRNRKGSCPIDREG